jgi:carboxymethylenebutenolidase
MGRWESTRVDGSEMRCYLSQPGGDRQVPAVVVIQHAGGVDAFVRTMTDRIAEAGFVGMAPDLYHRDDPATSDDPMTRMGRLRDKNIVIDVNAAIERLREMDAVRRRAIGITGFCMGGRVAYLMAATNPDLKAAVVFYGGNIMRPWGDGAAPFDLSENIGCPVLGLFGEDDGNPTPDDVAKIDGELGRLGKAHEFHIYPGAGHAFMNEGRPSHRPEVAADAWSKAVAWFSHHLGGR